MFYVSRNCFRLTNTLQECLLDVMSAFPRTLFSASELEVTRWLHAKLGNGDLPTLWKIQKQRETILEAAGVNSQDIQGAHKNFFTVNDLREILRQVSYLFHLIVMSVIAFSMHRNLQTHSCARRSTPTAKNQVRAYMKRGNPSAGSLKCPRTSQALWSEYKVKTSMWRKRR